MEQLFIVLIVGAIALVKWLSSLNGEKGTAPRDEETSEAERMRRFMEALGMPKSSEPPPRGQTPQERRRLSRREIIEQQTRPYVKPAPEVLAPRPVAFPASKVFFPKPPKLSSEIAPPAPPKMPQPKWETTEIPPDWHLAGSVVKTSPAMPEAPAVAMPRRDVRALLQSPSSLRDAIILREILGPPRGLQSA